VVWVTFGHNRWMDCSVWQIPDEGSLVVNDGLQLSRLMVTRLGVDIEEY